MAKAENLQFNNQEELTDGVEAPKNENIEKNSNFWDKAKNIISNKEVMKQFGKTAVGSIASIAGIKSFYDVPAYFKQKFGVVKDKKEYNEIFSNLGNEEVDENEIENKKVAEIVDLNQVEAMQDKIESMDVSEEIKDKLTQELNALVENYHAEMETLKKGENEKLTNTLDEYVKTKISGVQASKEALNTLFVASGAYGLRGLSYGALSVYERQQKLQQEANKEGKEAAFMKDVIIGGVKETFGNISFKGEGSNLQKALKAIKSFGSLARFAGIAETSLSAPENYGDAVNKLLDTLDGKTDFGTAGRNFVQNIENRTPFVGGVSEAEAGEIDMNNLTKYQKEKLEMMRDWPKQLGIEMTEEELLKIPVYGNRYDKAFDKLQREYDQNSLENTTHRVMEKLPDEEKETSPDGKTYSVKTPFGEVKSFKDDRELTQEQQKMFDELKRNAEKNNLNVTDEDIKQTVLAKEEIVEDDNQAELNSPEDSLESSIYTADGKKQFMKAMEKLAGSQAEEAYKQNFSVLQTQIDAYLNGSISGEEMAKWSQNFNDKLKSMGAESDIIEIQKLLKLERNIIGSGGADKNAW